MKGWARPIKYSAREYVSLVERAAELLRRLNDGGGSLSSNGNVNVKIDATQLEKLAYVLGKEATDLDLSDPSQQQGAAEAAENHAEEGEGRKEAPSKLEKQQKARDSDAKKKAEKEKEKGKAAPTKRKTDTAGKRDSLPPLPQSIVGGEEVRRSKRLRN